MTTTRPCLGPDGTGHCPLGAKVATGTRRRRCPPCEHAKDSTRDSTRSASPARQVYRTSRWRTLSQQIRADQPWCVMCGSTEDLTVDHITPLHRGGEPYDLANLQVLCRADQNRKRDQHQ